MFSQMKDYRVKRNIIFRMIDFLAVVIKKVRIGRQSHGEVGNFFWCRFLNIFSNRFKYFEIQND